jgi:hypothetical protein
MRRLIGPVVLAPTIRRAIEAGRREFDLQADELPSQSRPLVRVSAALVECSPAAW